MAGIRVKKRRSGFPGGLFFLPAVGVPGLEGYLRLAFGNIREEAIPEAAARFREFSAGADVEG